MRRVARQRQRLPDSTEISIRQIVSCRASCPFCEFAPMAAWMPYEFPRFVEQLKLPVTIITMGPMLAKAYGSSEAPAYYPCRRRRISRPNDSFSLTVANAYSRLILVYRLSAAEGNLEAEALRTHCQPEQRADRRGGNRHGDCGPPFEREQRQACADEHGTGNKK